MRLPEGYRVEYDPDVWTLIGPDGAVVARWIAGAPEEEVEAAAWDNARGRE